MFRAFRDVNVRISNATTPHALFESRAFAVFDWVGRALTSDPAVRTVLDVGAGRSWHFGHDLKVRCGFKLIGVDDSAEEMALNPSLDERIVGDACVSLGVPDGSVDLIVSRATVEHLADNAAFVRNAYKALRPGGQFALVFANKWSPTSMMNRMLPSGVSVGLLHALVPNSKGHQGFKAPYDRCSHGEFGQILKDANFAIEYQYNSYYSSSYFQFFAPLHALSIASDYTRQMISLRNLSSQCLFVARKPLS